jgi:hypothetical protein
VSLPCFFSEKVGSSIVPLSRHLSFRFVIGNLHHFNKILTKNLLCQWKSSHTDILAVWWDSEKREMFHVYCTACQLSTLHNSSAPEEMFMRKMPARQLRPIEKPQLFAFGQTAKLSPKA